MTRLAEACYRLVLFAFPASFRRRHGDAMLAQFLAQRRAVEGSARAMASLWVRALADALRHGIAYRFDTGRHRQTEGDALGPGRYNASAAGLEWIASTGRDLKHATRLFRRGAGVVTVAVGGLALAIALTTAVFSINNAFNFRPLGVRDPDRVVRVLRVGGAGLEPWSYAAYFVLRGAVQIVSVEASVADFVSHDGERSTSGGIADAKPRPDALHVVLATDEQ